MARLLELNGERFGKLTVIDYNSETKKWRCRCDCGNMREVPTSKLTTGRVVECKVCGEKTRIKPKVDLTGERFGEWEVQGLSDNNKWLCICSCGNSRELTSYELTSGHSKSCGHNSGTLKNIEDQRFGKLVVIEYAGNAEWICQCDCGNRSKVSGRLLRSGNTKSCGCGRGAKEINIIGQRFGDWKVIKYLGGSYWECECSCGNIESVHSYSLRTGMSTKCSNPCHRIKNGLVDKRFGYIVARKYIGRGVYECECDCGNIKNVLAANLVNGSTKSCGCITAELQKKALINKYGDPNPRRAKSPRSEYQLSIISSDIELACTIYQFIDKHGRLPYIDDMAQVAGVDSHTISRYIKKYNLELFIDNYNEAGHSHYEAQLMELFPGAELGNRTILNGKELDIYYPDKNIAIEFNGTYWHSSDLKAKNYHQDKTLECRKQGIRLIHVFEHEWVNEITRDKIINLLKSLLITDNKIIYAKNTEIRHVDKLEADIFLEKYHLQGSASSSVRLGLYYEDELIGIATFGKPRFNQNYEYELIRLAWMHDIRVVGGFERLFKQFIKEFDPQSIISYCDLSKFTGESYYRVGFKNIENGVTSPNYVWVNPSDNDIVTRYQSQKHKLIESGLGLYGDTEDEIMENLGYLKIYDSGNLRLAWNKE